ncbi:MAG TPA: hypothetical protein VMB85_21190 [Bryobacteraceae bacterium]|nr:hypothetical protein [Bryobacteraceae bacterium]
MTLHVHVQIVGALLLLLSVANLFFSRYFGWKKELASLSLLTRQVFQVHCFFIALVLMLLGACSLFYTDTLLEAGPLSRVLLAGIVLFWLCRLAIQFFVYDPAIWRGNRLYTFMHVVFSVLWIYVVITYGVAFHSVRNG